MFFPLLPIYFDIFHKNREQEVLTIFIINITILNFSKNKEIKTICDKFNSLIHVEQPVLTLYLLAANFVIC